MTLTWLSMDPEILVKLVASKQSMSAEAYAYDTCQLLGCPLPPWKGSWEASGDNGMAWCP